MDKNGIGLSTTKIIDKLKNKYKDIKNIAGSELKETKGLVKIIAHAIKSYAKKRDFDLDEKDIKFIQGQSGDVIKNIVLITISLIPIPIPITPFLIIFGKKIGIDLSPKEHDIPEKGKKKINEEILSEASKLKILTDKLKLDQRQAELLDRICGSLSVFIFNKIIEYVKQFELRYWEPGVDANKIAVELIVDKQFIMRMTDKLSSIMDWIRVGLNGNLGENKNLSLWNLFRMSEEWHDSLDRVDDINYKERGDIILDFRDKNGEGYYWVDTLTNDCKDESKRMGHCGRTNRGNSIYSLRKVRIIDNKYDVNTSHITAAIGDNDGILYQMKGAKNSKPKEEYYKYIIPLFYVSGKRNDYLIKGFGTEYSSKYDFKISDLNEDEIKNLYDKRPDLFSDFRTRRLLADLGIIEDETPKTFTVHIPPDELYRYFKRYYESSVYEDILTDPYSLWGADYRYYIDSINTYLDNLDEKNYENIVKILSKTNGNDLSYVSEDDILSYDTEGIIQKILVSSARNVDANTYSDYLYGVLRKTLETYGEVETLTDEGVSLIVNTSIFDDIDNDIILELIYICNDDIICVFNQCISDGEIELPSVHFDENWYNSDFDKDYFNELVSEDLEQYL